MSVTVRFSGDVDDLLNKQDSVKENTRKVNDEYRGWLKQIKDLDAAHKRFTQESMSSQDKHNAKLQELKQLWGSGRISAEQYHAAVKRANSEFESGSQRSQMSMGSLIKSVGVAAVAYEGIKNLWQEIVNIQEKSAEIDRQREAKTRAVQTGIASFVTLQPAGTERDRLNRVMEGARGVQSIAEAANMVQGLQSASDFETGMRAAQEVWAAARIGLPTELGGELAIQGMNSGLGPAEMVRGAVGAGIASARSPVEIARAAPSITLFDDKQFGLAIAGQVGTVDPTEIKSLTAAAQRGLSGASGAAEWFASQGLPENATQEQRLAAMQAAGIDTPDELRGIGIAEDTQVRALSFALGEKNFASLQNIKAAVGQAIADPAFLTDKLKKNEESFQEMRMNRLILEEESKRDEWQGFDLQGQERVLRDRMLFNRLRQSGLEKGMFGGQFFDEEGNLISERSFRTWADSRQDATFDAVRRDIDTIFREYQQKAEESARRDARENQRRAPVPVRQEK